MQTKESWWKRLLGSKPAEKEDGAMSAELRTAFFQMANSMAGGIFPVRRADCTKVVVGLIIARAMEMDEVLIYSHSLKHDFYGDVLRGLKCPARILLDDSSGLTVIKRLPQEIQNRISVRTHPSLSGEGGKVHFIVTDCALRCDVNASDDEIIGYASFNNPPKALRWKAHFDKLWESASSVSVAKVTLS